VIGPRVAVLTIALCVAAAVPPPAGAQMHPGAAAPAPAPSPFHITLDASLLAGLPRITLQATDESGHIDTYAGVSLRDLLTKLGAPAGPAVRGKAMLAYIIVGATDGYHVLFTLPELDASYTDHVVLIADTRNGTSIGPETGPYRLIVPFEKRQARWVKNVTDIALVDAPLP
jgi:hypothetical protein